MPWPVAPRLAAVPVLAAAVGLGLVVPLGLVLAPAAAVPQAAAAPEPAESAAAELAATGPVALHRGRSSLVVGRPGDEAQLREIAGLVDAAVPRVSAVWGQAWSRPVVVLVPADGRELAQLVPGADLRQLAAVATTDQAGWDRVVVDPVAFARLSVAGRRVVLGHEVVHVATRSASGPAVPAWLVEGFADLLGHDGAGVADEVVTSDLRAAVRAGRAPTHLPRDTDFTGTDPHLQQAYEQAHVAVRLLVEQHGLPRVVALYRALGAAQPSEAEQVFGQQLGTDLSSFTARWRSHVARLR